MKTLFPSVTVTKRAVTRLFSSVTAQSWLSVPGNPLFKWPLPSPPPPQNIPEWTPPPSQPPPSQNPNPNPTKNDFPTLCNLLRDPSLQPGPSLEAELDRTGIEPEESLLVDVFNHFDSSPKLLHSLFLWAEKKPGFQSSPSLFNSMVNLLGKAREFDSAWCLVLDRVGGGEKPCLVSSDTFAILIRRYNRSGMTQAAIRTLEYAAGLDFIRERDGGASLFEILLDSFCKEGHVRMAAECLNREKRSNPSWVPSLRMYNILLNGWFRSRKLKHAERLWSEMKEEGVRPDVVTYGTLVEGLCRMRRVEMAIDLLDEMRRESIEANAIVYNPIIDALAEAGRFKEVSGMLERFMQCELGPNISTYNSLVKGYCKAGDLAGASRILKMMIGRGVIPTATTYNYFFRHFAKTRKIEEGMNLYTKMIESGYTPDRLTYQLLLKLLCEKEKLDLAVQVSKEMKVRGCDMDLASGTMLTHLLCRMRRFEEAFAEFESMLRRGIVPQYLTFQRLNHELRKHEMFDLARRLCDMMSSVPHSTNLPNTYTGERDKDEFGRARRKSIVQKAEAMSDILKTCNDPRELVKRRSSFGNPVMSANLLMGEIKTRAKES
ncbi:hypothetical protein Tsubulata_012060 [Turnera subulata]|uniref:Pentacotripeptide-repeat region of PRORP domain-containing protein n=1 Tax=Turnera subulata TaxID=218843 RepID=A0A9Q0J4Q0_9ROSI|nr:hypothetical protein Tsubulata_012060 [Turnera subulata]